MYRNRRLIPFAEAKLPQSETGVLAGNRLEATFDDVFLSETAEDVLEELTLDQRQFLTGRLIDHELQRSHERIASLVGLNAVDGNRGESRTN